MSARSLRITEPGVRLADAGAGSRDPYRTFNSRFHRSGGGDGTPMTVTDVLPPRYRRQERVARGGMGEIYRAEDAVLARTVAVKLLSERFADDEGIRRRFTHEALAAARLSNAPGIVTIFDVGEHEGRPYIVMEYLPGGSLADRLAAEGAQPPGRVLGWLRQAAGALDAAHRLGIVHRDVKPANLLLDDDGNVSVADFGIASAAGLDSFTAAGTVLGTAGYLAPEQARGERATPASDVYALGIVAFELLTGSRPFKNDSATAEAAAHVNAPVPAASTRNRELPPEVDGVFATALAKNPDDRFPSATDLVEELRAALDRAAGRTVIAAPAVTPARRSLLPLAAAAAVALALGGALLAAVLVGGDDNRQATRPTPPTTVKETVTLQGTTVVQTVTTAPAAPTTTATEPPTTAAAPEGDAASLNDRGFELMRAGDYEGALPLLEQAVAGLSDTGSLTEAYASYNLAFTRLALGRCDGVLDLLDRSEEIQGSRKEISRLRKDAEKACGE
jgi:eukaryotic-like serine/threonine-protein kinase